MVQCRSPIGLVVALCLAAPGLPARQQPASTTSTEVVFRNIAAAAGVNVTHVNGASPDKYFAEIMGSGGLFFDFDDDGWIDIFLVDGGSIADPRVAATARHRLYRNRGNGTFEDVSAQSGIRHREYGMGACAGDYDNDGAVDLYVTNYGPNGLYRNVGHGRFTEVPRAGGAGTALWSTSCAFADVDRDGFLDLFVTNYVQADKANNKFCGKRSPVMLRGYCHPLAYDPLPNVLYRNTGKGTFEDISVKAGIAGLRGNGLGVAVTDVNDDGWPDVFVANDAVPHFLFHNTGKGTFTEDALIAGVAVSTDGQARAGMGTAFGDYDGDGRPDLVVTNHETEMHSLLRNLGDGLFAEVTVASGLGSVTQPFVGFGVVFLDYDNDADLDLSIVNGHVLDNIAEIRSGGLYAQRRLLVQNTAGRFRDVSTEAGSAFARAGVGRGLVAGDIDNDGDLDLLVTNNGGRAELLRNDGSGHGPALLLRLIGTKSNRDAIGARVRVTTGSRTQVREVVSGVSYLGQNDLRVHVGLGDRARVDRLEIRWPSGLVEQVADVSANGILTIREGQGVVSAVPFTR